MFKGSNGAWDGPKLGEHLRYFFFLSHLRFILLVLFLARCALYFLSLFFFLFSFGPSPRIEFGACFFLGVSTAVWVFFFSGCSLVGFFGSVLDFYADAIHDMKM
jgi:hypothetical protein